VSRDLALDGTRDNRYQAVLPAKKLGFSTNRAAQRGVNRDGYKFRFQCFLVPNAIANHTLLQGRLGVGYRWAAKPVRRGRPWKT
jgi:hypothetical protein